MSQHPDDPGFQQPAGVPLIDKTPESFDQLDANNQLMVELSADGRLRAPAQATREILRERLKKAEVMPTGPGWAVFRTLGNVPALAPKRAREVGLVGTISEAGVSLIDIIGFLAQARVTGVIAAYSGEVQRSVYFYNGDVVWASSTAPEDRLGEFLLRRGKITREQQQVAIRDGARKIGRACVDRGFIAAHELWEMVQAQLRETFDKLLATKNGMWTFSRVSNDVLAASQIHLSTQGLLVDALRRIDEMQVFREKIRSADVVVQRTQKPVTDDDLADLEPKERELAAKLLAQLPGTATIHELVRILGSREFDVTRLVNIMLRSGIVELLQGQMSGPIPRRAAISKTKAREVVEIYSMALREMFAELRGGKRDLVAQSITSFLRDRATDHQAVLRRVALFPDGALEEASILASVEEHGLNAQQLSDALSELMFFVLFQATEVLGRKRGDDLARRVKLIHGMLQNEGNE